MKVSALVSTSGLGQNIGGGVAVGSPPSVSVSSKSGEPLRELVSLLILTKSPCTTNFHSGILNGGGGGGGGGIGTSGDSFPDLTFSSKMLVFAGNGGLRAVLARGGGDAGGGAGTECTFLVFVFLEENRLWKTEEGGGGSGGGGGGGEGGGYNGRDEEG